ncbi:hypothetical protein D3C72_1887770 [compost metagenome]
MVGHDQQPFALQPLRVAHLIADHAHRAHQPQEQPESVVDHILADALAPRRAPRCECEQREHQHAQHQPAQPEAGKAQPGGADAPGTIEALNHSIQP